MRSGEPAQALRARVRIGMLTPSSNTVLEPVTNAMLAGLDSVSMHFSRFRVTDIAVTERSLAQFDTEAMLASAALLADARVHAIVWNGTSGGWRGLDADRTLCRSIEDRLSLPATTVTLALVRLLREAGARRIAFVTPYTEDVLARIERTFEAEGFACLRVKPLAIVENFAFSTIATASLDAMVAAAAAERPDVILPFCTNMAGAVHAARWEAAFGIEVFDANAVAVRAGLDLVGCSETAIPGWGRLLGA